MKKAGPRKPLLLALALIVFASSGCATTLEQHQAHIREVMTDSLQRVAVLPMVHDGMGSCDICPESVNAVAVDHKRSELFTAFVYESLSRHPRYDMVPHLQLQPLIDSIDVVAPEAGSDSAPPTSAIIAELAERDAADGALVSVLVGLADRLGTTYDPTQAASASVYLTLLDVRTGTVMWEGRASHVDSEGNYFVRQYKSVLRGERYAWLSAETVVAGVVADLVEDMVDELAE